MNREQAKKVVSLISDIAAGEASIRVNLFCESAEKAQHNRKLVEGWKQELVDLLVDVPLIREQVRE